MHLLYLKLKSALNLLVLFPASSHRGSLLLSRCWLGRSRPPPWVKPGGASKSPLLPGQEGLFPFLAKTGCKNGTEGVPGGHPRSAGRIPCGVSPEPPRPTAVPMLPGRAGPAFLALFLFAFSPPVAGNPSSPPESLGLALGDGF